MSKVTEKVPEKVSENEDDPEVYESSGEEWEKEEEKSNRRSSQRLSKKPRRTVVEPESSSEEVEDEEESETEDSDSEEEPRKRKSKNGLKKKDDDEESENKANSDTNSNHSESKGDAKSNVSRGIHRKFIPKTIYSEDYATGSFVILKKDAQAGDPSKHPSIWRIDGKALLQKYEAFDEEGKVRHKNTSIYTGWSSVDKDLYAPITVDVIHHNNQNLTVELHWDKLKEINVDSD